VGQTWSTTYRRECRPLRGYDRPNQWQTVPQDVEGSPI